MKGAGTGGTLLLSYAVPVGYRAVITCADIVNFANAGIQAELDVGTTTVAFAVIPGIYQAWLWRGHQVVYAGEIMKLSAGGTATNACVSGYLLLDDGTSPKSDLDLYDGPVDHP